MTATLPDRARSVSQRHLTYRLVGSDAIITSSWLYERQTLGGSAPRYLESDAVGSLDLRLCAVTSDGPFGLTREQQMMLRCSSRTCRERVTK